MNLQVPLEIGNSPPPAGYLITFFQYQDYTVSDGIAVNNSIILRIEYFMYLNIETAIN
jgi:hypothetical protein